MSAPDKQSAIDIIRRYISLSQKMVLSDAQANEMWRELEAYGPLTDALRLQLAAEDQPSNFTAVLDGAWPLDRRSSR